MRSILFVNLAVTAKRQRTLFVIQFFSRHNCFWTVLTGDASFDGKIVEHLDNEECHVCQHFHRYHREWKRMSNRWHLFFDDMNSTFNIRFVLVCTHEVKSRSTRQLVEEFC